MGNIYMKTKNITSKRQIVRSLLIFVVPFIIFFISYNTYMIKELNENEAEMGSNLINLYKSPIEKEINTLQQSIVDIMANDSDFQQIIYSNKEFEKYGYMQKVSGKLQRTFKSLTAVGGIIYEADMGLIMESYTRSDMYSYTEKEEFRNILKSYASNEKKSWEDWEILEVNGEFYMFRALNKKNVYVLGIYDLNQVINLSKSVYAKEGFLFLADRNMKPLTSIDTIKKSKIDLKSMKKDEYYISGQPERYLIVQNNVEEFPFKMVYATPYHGALKSNNKEPFIFMFVSVILMFLLWISYYMLERKYLIPFQKLVKTMDMIKNGDIEAKMDSDNTILEFEILSNAFNDMIKEIKALKIASYEYQIETQRAKLQYLQIQMKPHFFLNCLKNLYGLAEEGKMKQIQETMLVLSEHLRYMMRDNFHLIPLSVEVQSVKNYILLQQLTSYYPVICNIDIEESLKSYEIPPISILAFVENSIKHGDLINKQLKIQIKISSWFVEEERYISIMILDNGVGFDEDTLKELNGNNNLNCDGKYIGIQNVKDRFSLIYKKKVTFLFSNILGSGACVQIFIPISEQDLEKKKEILE